MTAELILAIATGILLPLNAATFIYAVSIERRLSRLEAREELRAQLKAAAGRRTTEV
jgi:hypothetical protein